MSDQPKINIRHDWPVWILLVAMVVTGFVLWPHSPEKMPVHWGIDGQPDRYGGKFEGLLAIPLLTIAVYFGMIFLPRIDPGRANYRLFNPAYTVVRTGIVVVLAAIYFLAQISVQNPDFELIAFVPVVIGGFFVVLGNLMPKIRPNWFVGIRSPWTLTSKLSWTRTHRFGGRTMMLLGVLLMPMGFINSSLAVWVLLALVMVWVIVLMVYSYIQWKRDPDRIYPANSRPAEEQTEDKNGENSK
jgi:uncharacterized membrane protein